jgi:hypothetical protein
VSAAWYANLVTVRRQALRIAVLVLAVVLACRLTLVLYGVMA